MKIIVRRKITHAIRVRPRDLAAIWKLLRSRYTDVRASATCSDGTILESTDVDEIVQFDNPGYRRVRKLAITCREGYDRRVDLEIEEGWRTTADITIASEDDAEALHLASELVGLVRDMRTNFSPLTQFRLTTFLVFLWLLYGIWSSVRRLANRIPPSDTLGYLSGPDVFNISLIIAALFLAAVWPLDRLYLWLFPRIFFDFGRQADDWQTRERWRSYIFVGFLLAVVASLVASWIFSKVT